MKDYGLNRSGFVFCLVIGVFLMVNPVFAADFCVGTSAELNTALATAASNGQDDIIKIQKGTYIGNFIYSATTENFGLTLEGGHSEGCTLWTLDATNTILDAQVSGAVLVLNAPNIGANFSVSGLCQRSFKIEPFSVVRIEPHQFTI